MQDKVLWVGAGGLFLAVLSLFWSAVLTFKLGWPMQDVQPWMVAEFIHTYGTGGRAGALLSESFVWALLLTIAVALPIFFLRRPTWYGDARWATGGEMRKAQLHAKNGLVLGKKAGQLLTNDEPIHALVAAPTRSGKGVGIVIPNLLLWPGSVIVLDIKHENYQLTAGARQQERKQPVYMWSPMSEHSASFNPLDFITPSGPNRISDIQRLATILLPDAGYGNSMWVNEARSLFMGLVLLVLEEKARPSTLGEVYRILMAEKDLVQIAEEALDNDDLDRTCKELLANFKNKASKERSGVKSNLTQAMGLWANPHIDAATADSSFDLRTLRKKPASVYVGVAQDQLVTLAPLLNLFFQQAVAVLSHALPGTDEPHEVLMLIDEFPMLGEMETLTKGLALLAGYNIRIVLICQGLGQLEDIYRQGTEGVLQNCGVQVFFASNDDSTTNYISRRLGTMTVKVQSRSQAQDWSSTTSTSYVARPMMPPEEVRRLSEKKAIIFKGTARPILAEKIRYYEERRFKKLLRDPPAVEEKPVAVVVAGPGKESVKDGAGVLDAPEMETALEELGAGSEG